MPSQEEVQTVVNVYESVVNGQSKTIARLRTVLSSILEDLDEESELAKEIWHHLKSEFEGEV